MRKILHVTVGDEDWEPTAEELSEVTAMFQKVTEGSDLNLIVTNYRIKSQLHDDTDNILEHKHVNAEELKND